MNDYSAFFVQCDFSRSPLSFLLHRRFRLADFNLSDRISVGGSVSTDIGPQIFFTLFLSFLASIFGHREDFPSGGSRSIVGDVVTVFGSDWSVLLELMRWRWWCLHRAGWCRPSTHKNRQSPPICFTCPVTDLPEFEISSLVGTLSSVWVVFRLMVRLFVV